MNIKSIIIMLASLLVILVAATAALLVLKHSKPQEPIAIEEGVAEDDSAEDDPIDLYTYEASREVDAQVEKLMNSDSWDTLVDTLPVDDPSAMNISFLGYTGDESNLIFQIDNTDIAMLVIEHDGEYAIEHFYNLLGEEYGCLYFINGMPDNKRECYMAIPNDSTIYSTDYTVGDTLTYYIPGTSTREEVTLNAED